MLNFVALTTVVRFVLDFFGGHSSINNILGSIVFMILTQNF
ncbi:hypothetical protein CWATWH8502_1211 [Crocosphaera watsonii WH 8502]|uniref:Uncharacterized protein n=3 Tax=Crocosphaera watsonii TaxID=263511 RepID=T2IPQ4_CROWT|nr:hypothetical protein CWATWH8502_1211 [Crocosphaera watsonii WH 8502]CCQ54742.1 hypothetical protein CWATWH0005_3706 [Crocosphaera watsonii WH 0005]CCQ60501.1 hypothetical protein CWATWH0401_2306 [Crocosphaera watsonii WH 0401]